MSLIPCPSCHRHARAEESCPFCGSAMVPAGSRPPMITGARRAAVIAVSAALASTAFMGCGDDTTTGGGGSGGNGGSGGSGGNGGETTDGGANAGGGGESAGGGGESAGGGGANAGGGGANAGGGGNGEGGNIAPPYGSPPF